MDGKVELTIERYEELRGLERGEHAKIAALVEELAKARDENTVYYQSTRMMYATWTTTIEYVGEYRSKVEVISQMAVEIKTLKTALEETEKYARDKANELEKRVTDSIASIHTASLIKRLKYLFTKEL